MTSTTRAGFARMASYSPDRVLIALLIASVIGAILQITLGGVVRVTGSGDGCPDWPLCYGRLIPPFEYHALLEWSHRTVGSLVGIVIIAATARAWFRSPRDTTVVRLTTAALILIAIVGGIGGAVVLNDLNPALRTLHLALAEMVVLLLVFALVAVVHRPVGQSGANGGPLATGARGESWQGPTLKIATFGAVAILVALLSGSYAVWRDAGAVCSTWPLCGGPLIPQWELTWIHMAHRALSGAAVVVVLWAAHRAYRLPGAPATLRWASVAVLVLAITQIFVGALNPWTNFAEWVRALHLSLATLTWVGMLFIVALIRRPIPWRMSVRIHD